MATLNRVSRRVTLCASMAIVAAMATTLLPGPAAADNDSWNRNGNSWNNHGQWRDSGYRYSQPHGYYYAPYRSYYYAPAPAYYPPAPYYAQPGLTIVVPIR